MANSLVVDEMFHFSIPVAVLELFFNIRGMMLARIVGKDNLRSGLSGVGNQLSAPAVSLPREAARWDSTPRRTW